MAEEKKSWFAQAWDGVCNSALGRTIGIADKDNDKPGLWGMFKETIGLSSSDETKGTSAAAQTETKGLWGWMKNSLLGRTFGLADEGNDKPGLWGMFKETIGLSSSENNGQQTGGVWGWMKNSLLGRTFGLADEGNNEPGLWGMFKNSMLGRTFGLQDEGNNEPGLWGWMKNSMLGRALGLADKKEASANTATAQQTQAQTASNGAVNDDVIVETPSQYKVVSQEKSNAPVHKVSTATKTASKAATVKAAAEVTAAPRPPVTPSYTVPSGFEYEKFNSQTIDFGSSSYTLGGNNLSSKDVSNGLGLLTAARNNGLTLNPDGSYNVENEQTKTSGPIQITLTGREM